MKSVVIKWLFVLSFLSSFYSSAENAYIIEEELISPSFSLDQNLVLDENSNSAFSLSWNQQKRSNEIIRFALSSNGNYEFQNAIDLSALDTQRQSKLLIQDDSLIIISGSFIFYWDIDSNGNLNYQGNQQLSPEYSAAFSSLKIIPIYDGLYVNLTVSSFYTFSINTESNLLTILAEQELTPTVYAKSATFDSESEILWIGSTLEIGTYIFQGFENIGGSIVDIGTYIYEFDDEFDFVNNAGIAMMQYDHLTQSMFVANNSNSQLFSLDLQQKSIQQVTLNDSLGLNFYVSNQLNKQLIVGIEDNLYAAVIDWTDTRIELSGTPLTISHSDYLFVDNNLILGVGETFELFQITEGNQLNKLETKFTSILNDYLPDNVRGYFFDIETNRLVLLGHKGNFDDETVFIFIWEYFQESNSMGYIGSLEVPQSISLANQSNYKIVGNIGNRAYLLTRSNETLNTSILVIEYNEVGLNISQEYLFPANQNINLQGSFLLNDTSLVLMHYSANESNVTYSICEMDNSGLISSCDTHQLFPEGEVIPLDRELTYQKPQDSDAIYAAPPMSSDNSFLWVFQVNDNNEQLDLVQSLNIPNENGLSSRLDNVFEYDNGKKLSFTFGRLFHYAKQSENNDWELVQIQNNNSIFTNPLKTNETNYFIGSRGKPFLFDMETQTLYESGQEEDPVSNSDIYAVTSNNKVIIVTIDEMKSLKVASFTNTKPMIFKSNFNFGSLEALQDTVLEIDIADSFINYDKERLQLQINGENIESLNHSKITWDEESLFFRLTNEDMFVDDTSDIPSDNILVSLFLDSELLIAFGVTPVNVNDAPELLVSIATQYLDVNETYIGDLRDYIADPDRESVSYSYSNIPPGMTAGTEGVIEGSIATSGTYTVTINASDDEGATLTFQLQIVVGQAVQPPPNPNPVAESGGGSFHYPFFIYLLSVFFLKQGIKMKRLRYWM
ncbi:Ig domain-containing protein [Glaciecola sp. 1036]|uniref:Ig domain-containing protein n=1 Tax=Alteromonadaceae TaxID=72275 RepID=UPI003D067983